MGYGSAALLAGSAEDVNSNCLPTRVLTLFLTIM